MRNNLIIPSELKSKRKRNSAEPEPLTVQLSGCMHLRHPKTPPTIVQLQGCVTLHPRKAAKAPPTAPKPRPRAMRRAKASNPLAQRKAKRSTCHGHNPSGDSGGDGDPARRTPCHDQGACS